MQKKKVEKKKELNAITATTSNAQKSTKNARTHERGLVTSFTSFMFSVLYGEVAHSCGDSRQLAIDLLLNYPNIKEYVGICVSRAARERIPRIKYSK